MFDNNPSQYHLVNSDSKPLFSYSSSFLRKIVSFSLNSFDAKYCFIINIFISHTIGTVFDLVSKSDKEKMKAAKEAPVVKAGTYEPGPEREKVQIHFAPQKAGLQKPPAQKNESSSDQPSGTCVLLIACEWAHNHKPNISKSTL